MSQLNYNETNIPNEDVDINFDVRNKFNFPSPVELEYPPKALTGSVTEILNQSYGNGIYIVTQGSSFNSSFDGWKAFDKNLTGTRWATLGGYNPDGLPISSIYTLNNTYRGDFLQITLPQQILLKSYSFYDLYNVTPINTPNSWVLLGTNDPSPSSNGNWSVIDIRSNITWPGSGQVELRFRCDDNYFKYRTYRVVIIQMNNSGDGNMTFNEMKLYGTYTNLNFPAYQLDSLSSSALTAMRGVYALRRILKTYIGPIVNVRRSSDNAQSDFYDDSSRILWTGAGGTGITYDAWIGASTGYVTTWYDQSGNGNHATTTTQAQQPSLDNINKIVSFTTNNGQSRLKLPDGTVPSGDSSYTISVMHGTITGFANLPAPFVGSGTPGGSRNLVVSRHENTTNYKDYWWGNDMTGGTYAAGNRVTFSYTSGSGLNRKLYVNSSSAAFSGGSSGVRSSTTISNFIAYGDTQNGNYLNGQIYYVCIFNTELSTNDRIIIEQINPYSIEHPVVALTSGVSNGYTVRASAYIDEGTKFNLWYAFDKVANVDGNTAGWCVLGATTTYNGAGDYIGTASTLDENNISVSGEWLDIQLPTPIALTSYSLQVRDSLYPSQYLKRWSVYASNTGTPGSWKMIDYTASDVTNWTSLSVQTFSNNLLSGQAFSYYRIVVQKVIGSGSFNTFATIAEWRLFGIP